MDPSKSSIFQKNLAQAIFKSRNSHPNRFTRMYNGNDQKTKGDFACLCPLGSCQYDAVSIWIFERLAPCVPIGIVRWNSVEATALHSGGGRFPRFNFRNVKNQQIVSRRCLSRLNTLLTCEFQMVGCIGMPDHKAIKTIMLFKRPQDGKPQTLTVKPLECVQVVTRSCYAQVCVTHGWSLWTKATPMPLRSMCPTP